MFTSFVAALGRQQKIRGKDLNMMSNGKKKTAPLNVDKQMSGRHTRIVYVVYTCDQRLTNLSSTEAQIAFKNVQSKNPNKI